MERVGSPLVTCNVGYLPRVPVKNRSGKCEGPEGGGGSGVEACDFTVSEGHGHPLRPSVRDGARVSRRPGPARLVLRVFFQKIYGFRAGISCSQSFLSEDLWFPSSGLLGRPGRCTVCRGPKTQVTFKTVPPIPRAQKLFKSSITHFYFFTY
jgi:hypothetical protein